MLLRGALPDNYYSRLKLDTSKLAALLDEIDKISTLHDGEQDFIGLLHHVRIRLHEQELTRERLVDGYSAQSRSVVITRGVIFPILARIENGVHKEMGHSVGQRGDDVAEFAVYLPHSQSLGYFLVARGVVVMLVEITVCGIAVDVHAIYVSGIVSPLEILGSGTHE